MLTIFIAQKQLAKSARLRGQLYAGGGTFFEKIRSLSSLVDENKKAVAEHSLKTKKTVAEHSFD